MTLTDASPLIALIDKIQIEPHFRCIAALSYLPSPMVTTWPCFTEAMYLLFRIGGWPLQHQLWRYVETDNLRFHALSQIETARMRFLMEQYRDTPMDLADASLVVASESLGTERIFTLDNDFRIYQRHGKEPFTVVP